MFHFADDEVAHQPSAPVVPQEQNVDYQPTISSHLPNPPGIDWTDDLFMCFESQYCSYSAV